MHSSQPTRILAVRHGETAWNVDARIQGHLDIALNERGQWQAERLADALQGESIHAVYASDLQRALHTAQAVASRHGLTAQPDAGLRERSFGHFQGRTFREVEETHPEDALRWRKRDPSFVPEGGGESLEMLQERIAATVERLARPYSGAQILLVAHGGVMDILYRLATRQGLHDPRTWTLHNTAVNRLLWTPQGLSLVGWGDTSHLDAQSALDESTT